MLGCWDEMFGCLGPEAPKRAKTSKFKKKKGMNIYYAPLGMQIELSNPFQSP